MLTQFEFNKGFIGLAKELDRKSYLLAEVINVRDECVAIEYADERQLQILCSSLEDDCTPRIDCVDCLTNDIIDNLYENTQRECSKVMVFRRKESAS